MDQKSLGFLFVFSLSFTSIAYAQETTTTQDDSVVSVVVNGAALDIVCSNGRKARGVLQGTQIMFDITEPDGSKSGSARLPSGGSTDPAVALGDGQYLAADICSS